jgi:hypothetical protein
MYFWKNTLRVCPLKTGPRLSTGLKGVDSPTKKETQYYLLQTQPYPWGL